MWISSSKAQDPGPAPGAHFPALGGPRQAPLLSSPGRPPHASQHLQDVGQEVDKKGLVQPHHQLGHKAVSVQVEAAVELAGALEAPMRGFRRYLLAFLGPRPGYRSQIGTRLHSHTAVCLRHK